jgi:hypothetical protein
MALKELLVCVDQTKHAIARLRLASAGAAVGPGAWFTSTNAVNAPPG